MSIQTGAAITLLVASIVHFIIGVMAPFWYRWDMGCHALIMSRICYLMSEYYGEVGKARRDI